MDILLQKCSMIAVIDCDNFFVSCEKLFRPELNGKPAIVLSNNDGCIIARSVEAKALSIPMGAPLFTIKELLHKEKVAIFPGNFTLYCDLSNRVMATLRNFASLVEVYSIDEAFVDLSHIPDIELEAFGEEIRAKILQDVGLSVSVGIAPTKTLAKIATHIIKDEKKNFAKQIYQTTGSFPYHHQLERARSGVHVLRNNSELQQKLQTIPVEEIWGIGRNLADRLHRHGITTCSQLVHTSPRKIQQLLNIDGVRIQKELQCQVCKEVNPHESLPQSIMYSRSFPSFLTEYTSIEQIVTGYSVELSAKLRKHNLHAGIITLYLTTKHHDPHPYSKVLSMNFAEPTNSSRVMIEVVQQLLRQAFVSGFRYRKAGIIANNLIRAGSIPRNIFGELEASLSTIDIALDSANQKFGERSIRVASGGIRPIWNIQKMKKSPCYTTKLHELLQVT